MYYTFCFPIILFPSWNFFCTWLVVLQWKHQRYNSLSQKVGLVKSCWLFCQFYNTYENSKYYIHYQLKSCSKLPRVWGAGFECELRTSKSGICLDQNFKIGWLCIEGKRWVGVRNLDFFVDVINEWSLTNSYLLLNMIFFFFSLSIHSLLFHSFFIVFAC